MFLSPLVLATHPTPGIWVVWQDCLWEDAVYGTVVLPAGFLTDLASTPQFLRASPAFDPTGLSRRPAAFHDGAYARLFGWDKAKADQFLRAALIVDGMSPMLADWYFDAVHDFGQSHWNDDAGDLTGTDFSAPALYQRWLSTQAGAPATSVTTTQGVSS